MAPYFAGIADPANGPGGNSGPRQRGSAQEKTGGIFWEAGFPDSTVGRFRYISRLLSQEDGLLDSTSREFRRRFRRGRARIFRESLRLLERDLAEAEASALANLRRAGIDFDTVFRNRFAIRLQLCRLRAAGWLFLIGSPSAETLSKAAMAGIDRIVQPGVIRINAVSRT